MHFGKLVNDPSGNIIIRVRRDLSSSIISSFHCHLCFLEARCPKLLSLQSTNSSSSLSTSASNSSNAFLYQQSEEEEVDDDEEEARIIIKLPDEISQVGFDPFIEYVYTEALTNSMEKYDMENYSKTVELWNSNGLKTLMDFLPPKSRTYFEAVVEVSKSTRTKIISVLADELNLLLKSHKHCDFTLEVVEQKEFYEDNFTVPEINDVDDVDDDESIKTTKISSASSLNEPKIVKIPIHKCIMEARSDFFSAAFNTSMSESQTKSLQILEFPEEVINAVITHIYTNQDTDLVPVEFLCPLLVAADLYILQSLKVATEEIISSKIDKENVVELIEVSHEFNCPDLEKACNLWIRNNGDPRD